MDKMYQMSKLEHNAFIEHCKSSEIFKKVNLNIYRSKPEDLFRASGEMAMEDEDRYYSGAHNIDWDGIEKDYFKNGRYYYLVRTKEVTSKGYDNGKERRWVKGISDRIALSNGYLTL